MKNLLLAALLALTAACRRAAPAPEKEPAARTTAAGARLIAFDERGGAFKCLAPADWKAVEDRGTGGPLAMFFGPAGGARRASISVLRYPNGVDAVKTPQDLLDALKLTDRKALDVKTLAAGGRAVTTFHLETPQYPPHGRKVLYMNREDVVLIPTKDGFFELSHVAPADSYKETLPIFDAVVESFQPRG
jgi:hypothetical protein